MAWVTVRKISRRPSPSPRVWTDVRTDVRSLVRCRHNHIFSAWWVTNFSYPWCFAGALRALNLRYYCESQSKRGKSWVMLCCTILRAACATLLDSNILEHFSIMHLPSCCPGVDCGCNLVEVSVLCWFSTPRPIQDSWNYVGLMSQSALVFESSRLSGSTTITRWRDVHKVDN